MSAISFPSAEGSSVGAISCISLKKCNPSLPSCIGKILILGSSFLTVCFITCAVVVNPLFVLPLVGVVAMAILGVKLIENPSDEVVERVVPFVVERVCAPAVRACVVNAPVGLKNVSNNCWANSMLQFLMNISNYRDAILRGGDTPLTQNMRRYLEAERKQERVARQVNTQEIRAFLSSDRRTHIDGSSSRQEDVSEALEYIFQQADLYNGVSEHAVDKVPREMPESSPFIGLSLGACDKRPFAEHISQYFNFKTDEGILRERKFIGNAPVDFTVKQERFYRQDVQETGKVLQGKHLQKIDVPRRYMLPAHFTTEEQKDTPYECDAFISHIGQRLNSGHYVAYVKKQNARGRSTFWECNDSQVTKITEENFFSKMTEAYFLHFRKV